MNSRILMAGLALGLAAASPVKAEVVMKRSVKVMKAAKSDAKAAKKVDRHSDLKFMNHYEAKLKALENYTVTFDDGTTLRNKKRVSSKQPAKKSEPLNVTLVSR